MIIHKISISIPDPLYEFVQEYQTEKAFKSRSEVIAEAIKLLRESQLEECYREANTEIDQDFDVLSGEGLDDEAW